MEETDISKSDSSPNASATAKAGCCVDCGGGRTVCDEGCIRKLAAMKCHATCGSHSSEAEKAKTVPAKDVAGGCADKCCEKAGTTIKSDTGAIEVTKTEFAQKQEEKKVEKKVGCCSSESKGCSGGNATALAKKSFCSGDQVKPDAVPEKKQTGCCGSATQPTNCCSGKPVVAATKEDACCGPKKEPAPKPKEICCSEKPVVATAKPDSCCAPKEKPAPKPKESCCSKETGACSGKKTPKDPEVLASTVATKAPTVAPEACTDHLQQAFSEYSSYLEKGLCICRGVLDRLDTCCGPPVSKKEDVETSSTWSGKSSSVATMAKQPDRRRAVAASSKGCEKSCCRKPAKDPIDNVGKKEKSCAEDITAVSSTGKNRGMKIKQIDVEKAAARQHVTLSVAGMTCTGCSKKATNVLTNIQGLSAIKVTFVTGVAEFDLDPNITSLQTVLPRIEKETGFKFSAIVSDFQTLDIKIHQPAVVSVLNKLLLDGTIESIEELDKLTYRICYDPVIVGARTLLSSIKGATLAPPGNDAKLTDSKRRLIRMIWYTAVAAVLTIPILVLSWSDVSVPYLQKSIVSLILATFVQAIAVPEFYIGALKSLIYSRVLEMDMLVVISITAAYVYSVVAMGMTHAGYTLETGEFFETSSLLITLVLLGRLVAAVAKVKAVSAVSLRSLQVEKALLLTLSGETEEIDARLLQLEDTITVPAHGRVVTDGIVIAGRSAIDESMITGESLPVSKSEGSEVIAGTINGQSPLAVHITRLPGKNSITDIANLVENALAAKPRIQDLADKVASYFIPVVIGIAIIVFGIWIGVAVKLRGENGGGAVGVAITYCIAVLAVSCPCALGLAVPMVLVIAGGVAAREGVIIKQADAIERGYKVTDIVFDKTGTLTKGDINVVHEKLFSISSLQLEDIISIAKSITKDNQHPISIAIAAYLQQRTPAPTCIENVESIPGAGIRCTWKDCNIKAGNPYWLEIEKHEEVSSLIDQGMSTFCITMNSRLVAVFGLKSTIRDEARLIIETLHNRKITCHIVSGDSPRVVEDVANTVGIYQSNIASRHSPAQKQEYVKALMDSGRIVLFCGDGTNDAVAVAQANVGVQIGTASDVTRGTADVVLLGGLEGVVNLLDISKRASKRIVFNFVWAGVYNVFAILLAGGAFVKARIPPAYAGLGEIVSVLPVIIVALTLARTKRKDYLSGMQVARPASD